MGEPVYEYKYLKTKVKEYYGAIKTNFLGNDMPTENIHYTSIACITIDSVVKTDEKCFPQVYLEECKYKIKKTQISTFIIELVSDSDSDDDCNYDYPDSNSDDDSDDDSDDK